MTGMLSNTIFMILFSFLSVGAVVFTPAFPELVAEFRLSDAEAQWMMTLFLLGTAFGCFPFGPLANRIGRKKTLFFSLIVSLAGTIFILASPFYSMICIGRLVQALGCAGASKISYTMIGDLHQGPAATRLLSRAMYGYAILPGIGTAIAGFLTPWLEWRGGFWFFLFFTLALIYLCTKLPETSGKRDLHALRFKKITSAYVKQFKSSNLIICSSLMGLSTAILFIFSQEAPFIAIDLLGLNPEEYGVFYLVPAFGIVAGSLITSWLANKISSLLAMLVGILAICAGSLFMGAFFWGSWISGWALFLPQILVQLGDAVLYINASSSVLSDSEDTSNASAVMMFINAMGSVMGTFFVGVFAPRSVLTLPVVFVLVVLIMIIFWQKLSKRHLRIS